MTKRQRSILLAILASVLPNVIIIGLGMLKTRIIIDTLGTEINGLYSLMTQLITFITVANLGIDSVFRVSYYKFLEKKNYNDLTKIYNSSSSVTKKVIFVMLLISLLISLYLGFAYSATYSFKLMFFIMFVFCLPTCLSFFGMKDMVLLAARQLEHINLLFNNFTVILRMIIAIMVLACTENYLYFIIVDSSIYIIMIIIRNYCIRNLNKGILTETKEADKSPLQMTKYVFLNKTASLIYRNSDVIVIASFLDLSTISVYNSYMYVVNSLHTLILGFSSSFLNSIGSLLHSDDEYKLNSLLDVYVIIFFVCTITAIPLYLSFSSFINAWIGLESFVVSDITLLLFVFVYVLSVLKLPIELIENSLGLYKKTYPINMIESIVNIVLSVYLIMRFGIAGLLIGTVVALCSSLALKHKVVLNHINMHYRQIFIYFLKFIMIIIIVYWITSSTTFVAANVNLLVWFIQAAYVFFVATLLTIALYWILFKRVRMNFLKILKKF